MTDAELIAELERLNAAGKLHLVEVVNVVIPGDERTRADIPRLLTLAKAGIEAQSARARALEEAAGVAKAEIERAERERFTRSWAESARWIAAAILALRGEGQ